MVDMYSLRSNVMKAMLPRFDITDNLSIIRCVRCRKNAPSDNNRCPCGSCVYCDPECQVKDWTGHSTGRCIKIVHMTTDVQRKAADLQRMVTDLRTLQLGYPGFNWKWVSIEDVFHCNFPQNIKVPSLLQREKDDISNGREKFFEAREDLLKELIREGMRSGNDLAREIATVQCNDLFLLRQDTDQLLCQYLLMGELDYIEDWYDLSCYCAMKGTKDFSFDYEVNLIWQKRVPHQDVRRSYFERKAGSLLITKNTHWDAIVHMFFVKYLLHIGMSNLVAINEHLLDNQDCIELIGEYAGMKKEWMKWEKNWYRDQALELIRHCFCGEQYYDAEPVLEDSFEKIKKFAADYFSNDLNPVIVIAMNAGMEMMRDVELSQKQDKNMTTLRWEECIRSYEADHGLVYKVNVRPVFSYALKKMNAMARFGILDRIANPSLCITEVITEAMKACQNRERFFADLFHFIQEELELDEFGQPYDAEWSEEYQSYKEYAEFQGNNGWFYRGVLVCLLIERRLAQCNFHRNKGGDRAKAILDLLPGGQEFYTPDPQEGDSMSFQIGSCCFYESASSRIGSSVSEWLTDVTKVVDALFEADLATEKNLTILFGKCGYVSYRIWELQERKKDRNQRSIVPFVTRKRIWQEGVIDFDSSSRLKIKFLSKVDRRQRFEDTRKLDVPTGNSVHDLQPSLKQFEQKFGWDKLGIESDRSVFGYYVDFRPMVKRRRYNLDDFDSIEEACRHYFDTASLEEAIWDLVGIPRLLVLNGDVYTIDTTSWNYCRASEAVLGDKSVQMGSRVAHSYGAGWCTILKEKENEEEEER